MLGKKKGILLLQKKVNIIKFQKTDMNNIEDLKYRGCVWLSLKKSAYFII